jgi:2-methylcitrate dehydratase PrpD
LLLGLDEDATVSAIGLAANTASGLNEWPYSGGDEMFFHPGFAARNAVAAVELAELGAFSSETALDGKSGLFAALNRSDRLSSVAPFQPGEWEILSIYFKPAPACNYAQTACQAALAAGRGVDSAAITGVQVSCPSAAVEYPGCNFTGPFSRILQAKMSIQYCVAATLASNYHVLNDPEVVRLISVTKLTTDAGFTSNYPATQGAEVRLTLHNGEILQARLNDLIPASPADIRERFHAVSNETAAQFIESLETQQDIGALFDCL